MLALRDEREESNDRSLAVKRLRDLLVKRRHAGEHAAVGEVFLSCVQVTSFCVCTVANPSMSHVSIFHHSAQWHSETATAPATVTKTAPAAAAAAAHITTRNHTQPHTELHSAGTTTMHTCHATQQHNATHHVPHTKHTGIGFALQFLPACHDPSV